MLNNSYKMFVVTSRNGKTGNILDFQLALGIMARIIIALAMLATLPQK